MKPRVRHRAVLATLVAALGRAPAGAAEYDFQYDAGLSSSYSQDARRTGDNEDDAYVSAARASAGLLARTPRSETSLLYRPEYVAYEGAGLDDHLDHRLRTDWRLRMGPLSSIEVRQGLTETRRQVGFLDFAGVGGNPSEPITETTRRVAWDVQPRLSLAPSQETTATIEALYREESYGLATLVDSRQVGLQGGFERRVGRFQSVGGRIRADSLSFATETTSFDRFFRAEASWARRVDENTYVQAGAGAYRSTGPAVDAVVRPTADVSGRWTWRRLYLLIEYELSYSTGGGISTSNRSQWGHVALNGTWGRGFEAGSDLGYIYRAAPDARLGGERALGGRSLGLHLAKSWLSGVGVRVRLNGVRQERQTGADLDYWEGALGMTYSPSSRAVSRGSTGWRPPVGEAAGGP
jgi:hypothetical protein